MYFDICVWRCLTCLNALFTIQKTVIVSYNWEEPWFPRIKWYRHLREIDIKISCWFQFFAQDPLGGLVAKISHHCDPTAVASGANLTFGAFLRAKTPPESVLA